MNSKTINTILYRPLKKGKKYDDLIPFSDCSSTKIASGNTKVAIDSMAMWSKRYKHHTALLSKKEFANLSLDKLCKKLHGFLYEHLQYKIDEYDQLLRSPACAWATRAEGLDCKSYSIFASCVLQNCGVSHYLRRVVTNEGEGFSHVYVIVPKNQHTYDLEKGYYTIDGTLKTFKEQHIYKSDDVFITAKASGLSGGVGSSITEGVGKLVSYAVDEFIAEMNSCSGSVYDASVVELKIRRDLRDKLQVKIDDLGDAILYRNRARIQHLFNEIFKEVDLGIAHLRNETGYSSFEHCDAETLANALAFAEKLKTFIDNFYKKFKKVNTRYTIEEFTADYRFIVLRQEENTKEVAPIFPFEANIHTWLQGNLTRLAGLYTDGREKAYEKEITPIINKIIDLREKATLGGEMLYYFEQPLQRELYRIWLAYDTDYVLMLKEKAQGKLTANELALRDYETRFAQTIAEDINAKKRKTLKMQLGIGGLVPALLYVYLKKR